MVKIKYKGPKLISPEMKEIKELISSLKKDLKGIKCPAHYNHGDSIIHLRYIKEINELEKHVNACCYEFENILKERLPELHQVNS